MPKNAGREHSPSASKPVRRPAGSRRLIWLVGAGSLAVAILAFALLRPSGGGQASRAYALAPESALPARVRAAPPAVREAYRFAIANREILSQIPCYCGCGAVHQNNYQCYIKAVNADGSFVFDDMSLG